MGAKQICLNRVSRVLGLLLIAMWLSPGDVYAKSTFIVLESQPEAPAFSDELRAKLNTALLSGLSEIQPKPEPRTRHLSSGGVPLFTNRLLLEKSPYLQQHAHNPVNWFPWGPEAFAEARRLDRPVLVSIGYSTCHWCHVMEEESFDSVETAKVLNANFIAIKVDREARPDIDSIYMSAIHAMGERGGWPLNMFVTPDAKPFFGGTYFPPEDRGGRFGFVHLLKQISQAYRSQRGKIEENANRLATHLKGQLEGHVGRQSSILGDAQLTRALDYYKRAADPEWGGLGRGTKFPSSLPIGLLLRESRRKNDEEAMALVRLTLDRMAAGGIHDHLDGGFHRYATEARWLVPHFEKMLYDNALIAVAYLEAYQATGNAEYGRVVRDILDYAIFRMMDPSGGFYSATDADSRTPEGESEEGAFFSWSRAEIESLLGKEAAALPIAWYGVIEKGPLEGRNVLHVWRDAADVAEELGMAMPQFDRNLAVAQKRLLAFRDTRDRPLRDEKILVAWNGLMISALAKAGFALDEPRYVESAKKAAGYILDSMRREGRLARISLYGEVDGPAFLEDYAFLISGLIDLYEATGESCWIEAAMELQSTQDEFYLDAEGGGYFRTANDGEGLLAREKPIEDGALPSGNSIAASNLSRLASLTGNQAFLEKLDFLYSAFDAELSGSASTSAALLETISDRESGIREVVVVMAKGDAELDAFLDPLRSYFVPNRVLIRVRDGEDAKALEKVLPIVRGKTAIAGKTTAYVCEDHVCQFPTNDAEKFAGQIKSMLSQHSEDEADASKLRELGN